MEETIFVLRIFVLTPSYPNFLKTSPQSITSGYCPGCHGEPSLLFKMATKTSIRTDEAERKRKAISYLKENDVPKYIEILLNDAVNDNPDDLFGYMV